MTLETCIDSVRSMSSSDYLDCELYLADSDRARLSVAGREYFGRPRLDEDLKRRLLEAALDPIGYGTCLFEALLPAGGDLLAGYREGSAIARHEEKRLRFRLHVAPDARPELHDLHWEALYDPRHGVALGRSRGTAFSRYLGVGVDEGQPVAARPRLLVVVPAPADLADFRLAEIDGDAVTRALEEVLGPLRGLDVEFLRGPATLRRLCDRLLAGDVHALHLHTHGLIRKGAPAASLVLEAEDGRCAFAGEAELAEIFAGELALRLITLIACSSARRTRDEPFSGLGQALVRRGIPAVLAMRRPITVQAAAQFTAAFYRNLDRSGLIDEAVSQTRMQLHVEETKSLEWSTPILFMRLLDGRLWQPRPPDFTPPPPPDSVPWPALLARIEAGKLIPFLGSGIHRGLLPSNEEIACRWADEYHYPLDGSSRQSIALVSQYLEAELGRHYPHDILSKLLIEELLDRLGIEERRYLRNLSLGQVIDRLAVRYFGRDPNEPHRILAELPITTFMTTNYDSFMTAALRWVGKDPKPTHCRWQIDLEEPKVLREYARLKGSEAAPLVFHLYGNDEAPTRQVLTEDDYLDFLREISVDYDKCIPYDVRRLLSGSMLLFLGYKVRYLDCRVLFRGLIKKLRNLSRGRLAFLQPPPAAMFMPGKPAAEEDADRSSELRHFIERNCGDLDIEVYWGSDRDFLVELRDRWKARHGNP